MDSLLPENRDFGRIDADPLQPLLEHHHHSHLSRDDAHLFQLSALWHSALEHFNDDARRWFSLHHSMHRSWSAKILDSLKKFSWAIATDKQRLQVYPLKNRKRAFLKGACFLYPEGIHFFVDMLQAKAWIMYLTTCFSCIVMYIWTWTCKKMLIFYPVNRSKSSWSSDMAERQERQIQRGSLVQISLTAKDWKGKRKPREHWREWSEKERRKKSVREVKKLESCFVNAVSINLSWKTIAGIYN